MWMGVFRILLYIRFLLFDVCSGIKLFAVVVCYNGGVGKHDRVLREPFKNALVDVGGSLCCLTPPHSYFPPLVFELPYILVHNSVATYILVIFFVSNR
jgi:hypothetical protein